MRGVQMITSLLGGPPYEREGTLELETKFTFPAVSRQLMLLLGIFVMCGTLSGQSDRRIIIRMLDSKTGQSITGSEFVISFDKLPDLSKVSRLDPYWKEGGERNGILDMPFEPGAASIAVRSSYGPANWSYVNCDSVKDHAPHWYPIGQILQSGIAVPNWCNKRKATAKPGEFLFFVRPMTFWEKMRE